MSDPDHAVEDDRDDCERCGGEGFIANCWEPFACIGHEIGCDDCLEPCPACHPLTPPEGQPQ